MELFKKSQTKTGEDILDLLFIRGNYTKYQKREILREKANIGIEFVRVFNAHKDDMLFPDYNDSHYDLLKNGMELLFYQKTKKQMLIPILDLTGYALRSLQKLTHDQWEIVFKKTVPIMIEIFGNNWIASLPGNEVTKAPETFKYKPKKSGMPGQMEKLGAWCNHMTKLLISLGVEPENIMGNVIDDPAYPKKPSTGDMIIGETKSDIGIGGIVGTNNVIVAYHNIHFPEDIKTASGRIFIAKRLWKYILTNDGDSWSGKKGHGVDPSCKQTGRFKNVSDQELYDTTKAVCLLTKKGVGKHKISIWMTDLFRDHYSHDIFVRCEVCGKNSKYKNVHISKPRPDKCKHCGGKAIIKRCQVVTDWNYIRLERTEKMAQAVIDVFGKKALPNRGKFPPISEEEIIHGEPFEDTHEIIIPEIYKPDGDLFWYIILALIILYFLFSIIGG